MLKALTGILLVASGLSGIIWGAEEDFSAPKLDGHIRVFDHCSVDGDRVYFRPIQGAQISQCDGANAASEWTTFRRGVTSASEQTNADTPR